MIKQWTRVLSAPLIYLMLEAGCVFTVFTIVIGTHPVVGEADSQSYLNFPMDNPADMLVQIRTVGYPIFLKLIKIFSPDLNMLPQLQISFFFVAIFVFYVALRIYGLTKWTAFVAVSPLFYQRFILAFSPGLMADVPAAALAILSVSFLFVVTARGHLVFAWIGLALSVFFAYQFRPAYVFLVPLVPVLGLVLITLRGPSAGPSRLFNTFGAAAVASTVLPFLIFCTLRFVVVGQFGLVSFGGLNVIPTTIQFLTKDVVKHLDQDLQPLAQALIEARDRLDVKRGLRKEGEDGTVIIPMALWEGISYHYRDDVFRPIVLQFLGINERPEEMLDGRIFQKDEAVKINRIAIRLAFETFFVRPGIHVFNYLRAFLYGIGFAIYAEGTIVAFLLLLFMAYAIATLRSRVAYRAGQLSSTFTGGDETVAPCALIIVGGLFCLANLLVVTAVLPVTRLILPGVLFVPCAISTTLFKTVVRVACPPKTGPSSELV